MKINILIKLIFASVLLALASGCSDSDKLGISTEYGYVQMKVYKAQTRADQLDYLAQASKIKLSLTYNNQTIEQTLGLYSYNEESAEFGLTSDKLQLLEGNYRLVGYYIYNKIDEEILYGEPDEPYYIDIKPGQLTIADLDLNVINRGKINFVLDKDFSKFTRSERNREYAFSEIRSVTIKLRNMLSVAQEEVELKGLKTKLVTEYGKSYMTTDSIISLPASEYKLVEYTVFSNANAFTALEIKTENDLDNVIYKIEDNKTNTDTLKIEMYESDEYIKDYYALKRIWEELDGKNWSWWGETYPLGSNWDFTKDIDLWGEQPGVALHDNGRVAAITLGQFGPKGYIPDDLGQLSELTELWLGSHYDIMRGTEDDLNTIPVKPSRVTPNKANRNAITSATIPQNDGFSKFRFQIDLEGKTRFDVYKQELKARKQKEYTPNERMMRELGGHSMGVTSRASNTPYGTFTNQIMNIPEAIGKLTKLKTIYIGNGMISELPDSMEYLVNLTDLEIYNCPFMTEFPMVVTKLPELVSFSLSQNKQISAFEMKKGLDALFTGPAKELLQLLYCSDNSLEEIPLSITNMLKMGLIDFADNKIKTIPDLGTTIRPVMMFLDNNQLESLPASLGDMRDLETFSCAENKLTLVPDIFKGDISSAAENIYLSNNLISGFENGDAFRGIMAETLDLSNNKFSGIFPKEFVQSESEVNYLILADNQIDSISNESITPGQFTWNVRTLDLRNNQISSVPKNWANHTFPYLTSLVLNGNRFADFNKWQMILNCANLAMLQMDRQRDENGNRCLRSWPTGIEQHLALRVLSMEGNDILTVSSFPEQLNYLYLRDNPNIVITVPDSWCNTSLNSRFAYDKTQDVRGCTEYVLKED